MHGGIVLILWLCITVILRRGDRVKLWEWGGSKPVPRDLGRHSADSQRLIIVFSYSHSTQFSILKLFSRIFKFLFPQDITKSFPFPPNYTRTSDVSLDTRPHKSQRKCVKITSDRIFNWIRINSGLLSQEDHWRTAEEGLLWWGPLGVSLGLALCHNSRGKWKIWQRMRCNQSKCKKGRRANCRGKMMTMQQKSNRCRQDEMCVTIKTQNVCHHQGTTVQTTHWKSLHFFPVKGQT